MKTPHVGHPGYAYIQRASEMENLKQAPALGLFAKHHLKWEIDRVHESPIDTPSIRDMAVKAVELLQDKGGDKGFFLMVEGSKIDKAAHPNDVAAHLHEILAYDEAVGAMLEFARKDGHTLVISTSDHETGGLTLGRGVSTAEDGGPVKTRSFESEDKNEISYEYQWYPERLTPVTASGEHMQDIALEAVFGKDTEPTHGMLNCESSECAAKRTALIDALTTTYVNYTGFILTDSEKDLIKEVVNYKAVNVSEILDYDFDYAYQRALNSITSARAHVGWTTWSHTGVDVNLYSYGPGSEEIRGSLENTEVGTRVEKLMGWDLPAMTKAFDVSSLPDGWKTRETDEVHPDR